MTIALHGMLTSRNFGDVLLADLVAGWCRADGRSVVAPFAASEVAADLGLPTPGGIAQLRRCEHLVFCGGGYFGLPPVRPWRKDAAMVAKFASRASLARLFGIPYSFLGIGASHLGRPVVGGYLRHVFDHARVLATRDEQATATLRTIGVRHSVETLADIVLTLAPADVPPPAIAAARADLADFTKRFPHRIGLHLSATPEAPGYREIYAAIDDLAAALPDIGFVLIEDHAGSAVSDQTQAIAALAARFGGRVQPQRYRSHWDLVALLGEIDGLVTNKLHTAIVASALGRPALAVAKHPKNANFFAQIGQPGRCFEVAAFDPARFHEAALHAFAETGRAMRVPDAIRARADRNRTLLLDALR